MFKIPVIALLLAAQPATQDSGLVAIKLRAVPTDRVIEEIISICVSTNLSKEETLTKAKTSDFAYSIDEQEDHKLDLKSGAAWLRWVDESSQVEAGFGLPQCNIALASDKALMMDEWLERLRVEVEPYARSQVEIVRDNHGPHLVWHESDDSERELWIATPSPKQPFQAGEFSVQRWTRYGREVARQLNIACHNDQVPAEMDKICEAVAADGRQ